jgi:hypothetical protein
MSNQSNTRPVLRAGDLAYVDSMAGMIPCLVISIRGKSGAPSAEQRVIVRLTARRGCYARGLKMEEFGNRIVPRAAYFPRRHGARIGYYTVET